MGIGVGEVIQQHRREPFTFPRDGRSLLQLAYHDGNVLSFTVSRQDSQQDIPIPGRLKPPLDGRLNDRW